MNSTGEKNGYKVILLLVVGLTAFSSAMKELNNLQQFTLDASRLIAQWSDKFAPAQIPQITEIQHTAIKVETCELKQSVPSVELPWLAHTVPPVPSAVVPRPSQAITVKHDFPKPAPVQLAKLKKLPQIDIDPVQFEVRITADHDAEPDVPVIADVPFTMFKTRARKQRDIRINPRDREVLLKTLNRSINLRFTS